VIFITVGSTAFDPLIKQVDEISTDMKEEIICQIADGKYIPKNCQYFRYKLDLEKEYSDADLVICHGGAGTLFNLMKLNKKVIAVPNLVRKDKHQTDLIDALSGENYIIVCYDLSELRAKMLDSKKVRLDAYKSPECRITQEIVKFIGE
jgi:beta-1,4-N-acetylglucosaminyltransferase